MTQLGQRIRELRLGMDLTVQEFAEQIGKSPGYVSRIETRDEIPSAELLVVISELFRIRPEELFALAKSGHLDRVAEQIDAKQQGALVLFRKQRNESPKSQ